jgi:RNA 2',3'-cyclic 3'-phosphodiesterase
VRLFAAVYPPAEELDRLAAAVGTLPDTLRPVPREQWHLTTAFYGEVPDAHVEALTERLARAAARTSPFSLRLAGAGSFPGQVARARQVWIGVDGDAETLARLAERCVAAGRREGLPGESRRYRPHLTLARARRTTTDATALVEGLSSYAGELWTVTELTLMKSTLGAAVHHQALATFHLSERPYQA